MPTWSTSTEYCCKFAILLRSLIPSPSLMAMSPIVQIRSLPFLLLLLLLLATCLQSSQPPPDSIKAMEELLMRLDSKMAAPEVQEAAARGVLQRLLPSHNSSFQFEIVSKVVCGGCSCFKIDNLNKNDKGPEIMIKGTSAVELVSGLHWYLKYLCGAHVSWDKTGGLQVASIPRSGWLPRVADGGILIKRPVQWNYYQNVVTSSWICFHEADSFFWWDWKRWEKEIDWMALQGVNLPLAFTGQEAIWQKVFKEYNVNDEDLGDFFGGPAFLAWARMGNLHGWGGPLSQNWLDQQLALQKLILSRMLELGMTPVLPSFSGNVPAIFKKMFPSANISRLGNWNTVNGDPRWCCTFLLDPTDPLFVEFGEAFIREQIKEYGDVTDIYNCDTFNENEPPTSDPAYIASLGSAVYKAMSKGDKDAVWLMQGWLFSSDSEFWSEIQMKALLHSVPFGKMVVLDLFAEVTPIWKKSSQFYGVPYVWCMLHNFGGNIEMYGVLDAISYGPIEARESKNSTMVGVGMCMEGIEQNPVVYELMSEMAFRDEKVNVKEWLKDYSSRRYGQSVSRIETAWQILYHTIYNCTDGKKDHNRDFIVYFPDTSPSGTSRGLIQKLPTEKETFRLSFRETINDFSEPHIWYSTEHVIAALRLFIDGGNDLLRSPTYRYDLVDLTRQVLAKLSNQVFLDAIIAYRDGNVEALILQSQKFIGLIKDMDNLLASDDNFLLGTWLEGSKRLASNENEKRQYEWNARTQVTMWFDNTNTSQSKLHDYANKYWSGLLKSYYLPRASSYFNIMLSSLKTNMPFDLERWTREWVSYSNKWQAGVELYPVKAEGDAFSISKALVKKYFG